MSTIMSESFDRIAHPANGCAYVSFHLGTNDIRVVSGAVVQTKSELFVSDRRPPSDHAVRMQDDGCPNFGTEE